MKSGKKDNLINEKSKELEITKIELNDTKIKLKEINEESINRGSEIQGLKIELSREKIKNEQNILEKDLFKKFYDTEKDLLQCLQRDTEKMKKEYVEQKQKIILLSENLFSTEAEKRKILSEMSNELETSRTTSLSLNDIVNKKDLEIEELKLIHQSEINSFNETYLSQMDKLEEDAIQLKKEMESKHILEVAKLTENYKQRTQEILKLENEKNNLEDNMNDLTIRNIELEKIIDDKNKSIEECKSLYDIRLQDSEAEIQKLIFQKDYNKIYLSNIVQNCNQNNRCSAVFLKRDNRFSVVSNTGDNIELFTDNDMITSVPWFKKHIIICKIINLEAYDGKRFLAYGDEYIY